MLSPTRLIKGTTLQRMLYLRSTTTALSTSLTIGRRYQSTIKSKDQDIVPPSKADQVTPKTEVHQPKVPSKPGYFLPPNDPGLAGKFQEDYEKIAKYTLLPLTMLPFCTSYAGIPFHPMLDAALGSVFLMYTHYGFSSLIYQYLPKEKFPRWSKVSLWSLYSSTCLAFYGLYEIETESNGIVDLIKKLWNYDESNVFIFGRS